MLAAAGVRAEIIDRIAVTAGSQAITLSDIDREIRVTAFLNGAKPDFSVAGRRQTADRMIEQRLVRRELELSRYPTPEPSEVEPMVKALVDDRFPKQGEYQEALSRYGITDQDVQNQLLWQMTFLRFVQVRFRGGAQVTEAEIKDYFEKNIKPAAQRVSGGEPVLLDDYRERVEEILTQQQVDRDLDAWMIEAKKRAGVEYRKEAFQP
jgi:hypothetical protein